VASSAQLQIDLGPEAPVVDPERDYVGYFQNLHGERLLFVQKPGQHHATVFHSDAGWNGYRVTATSAMGAMDRATRPMAALQDAAARSKAGKGPREHDLENLILDVPEAGWVTACWLGSEPFRRTKR
jgi:hypothetical protein